MSCLDYHLANLINLAQTQTILVDYESNTTYITDPQHDMKPKPTIPKLSMKNSTNQELAHIRERGNSNWL